MSNPPQPPPTLLTPAASPQPSGSSSFPASSSTSAATPTPSAAAVSMEMDTSLSSGPDSSGGSSATSELETIIDSDAKPHGPTSASADDIEMFDDPLSSAAPMQQASSSSSTTTAITSPRATRSAMNPKGLRTAGRRRDPNTVIVGGQRADGGRMAPPPSFGSARGPGWWGGLPEEEGPLRGLKLLDEDYFAKNLDFGDPFLEQLQAPRPKPTQPAQPAAQQVNGPSALPTDAPAAPPAAPEAFAGPAADTAAFTDVPAPSQAPGAQFVAPPPPAGGPLSTPMASPKSDR